MKDLLTLAVAGGLENDLVLIDEGRCGYSALLNAALESCELDLDWASLYISHADTSLRCPVARFKFAQEKASCLIKQRRFKEANETLLRNLSDVERFFGKDSARYGKVLHLLGWNCLEQGDKGHAAKYYAEAVRNLEKHRNVERHVMYCLFGLGSASLVEKSKLDVSKSYLNKALIRAERNCGKDSELYSRALCKMADFEEALGNVTKAAELRKVLSPDYQHADFVNTKVPEPVGNSSSANPSNICKKRKKKKRKKNTKEASVTRDRHSCDDNET